MSDTDPTEDAIFECSCGGSGWVTHVSGAGGGRIGARTERLRCTKCMGDGWLDADDKPISTKTFAEQLAILLPKQPEGFPWETS